MRRIWNHIVQLLYGRARSRRLWQEDLYASASDRDALLDADRDDVRNRERTVQVVGPPVSSDGVAWDDEQIEYWHDERATVTLKLRVTRLCDCGAAIAGETRILGTCSRCARILCNAEGCSGGRCERCGEILCRRHAHAFGDHTFCPRHLLQGLGLRLLEAVK